METTQITLRDLAEKLDGNYWEKGDLKRVYLNEGYNTKKMTTKTFVWQDEKGEFKVSCRIECPSQPDQWISSQEDQVKEHVYRRIENMMSDTVYIMTNKEGEYVDWRGTVELNHAEYFFTEKEAEKEIGNCANYESYVTMSRNEFDAEIKRLEEVQKPKLEKKAIALATKIEAQKKEEEAKKEESRNTKPSDTMYGVGTRVNHNRFGIGFVFSETKDMIEVDFEGEGIGRKSLIKKFVKLEKVD